MDIMDTGAPSKRSPLKFFILTFVLATPIWALNSVIRVEGLPLDIPVTDLVLAFMPMIAAAILVYREEGPDGARWFLMRAFDYKRIRQKTWYVPIVLLMPFLFLLIYGVMLLLGLSLPAKPYIPFLTLPFLFVLFFLLAIGEEMGWTGYATDPLQERWSALTAALIIGLVMMIGHFPSMIVQGRDVTWIAWSTFGITGWRILAVWLYNSTGRSVFAVIFFHAMINVCRAAFPIDGTHNPLVDYPEVHYSVLAIAGLIVAILWDRETLSKYRYAPLGVLGRRAKQ